MIRPNPARGWSVVVRVFEVFTNVHVKPSTLVLLLLLVVVLRLLLRLPLLIAVALTVCWSSCYCCCRYTNVIK